MQKDKILSLGKVDIKEVKQKIHTPSTIQADTLFTFTRELDFLISYLVGRMISPRYCVEDIRYLKIPKLKKIAFPMKCFCDINMHRLDIHLAWYGYYGIAFSKEWGMSRGIQPIQYINPSSELRKDFTSAFTAALKLGESRKGSPQQKMQNYMLHELMYYKPYEGKMENRNTGKTEVKCFTDECEWRFIPDVTRCGFEQAYHDNTIISGGVLQEMSNSMSGLSEIALTFEYEDIKYIIVKTKYDFEKLVKVIMDLDVHELVKYELMSKVIIWELSGRDF